MVLLSDTKGGTVKFSLKKIMGSRNTSENVIHIYLLFRYLTNSVSDASSIDKFCDLVNCDLLKVPNVTFINLAKGIIEKACK